MLQPKPPEGSGTAKERRDERGEGRGGAGTMGDGHGEAHE